MSSGEDIIVTRWWFVRHAPVVDAKSGKLSGQADIEADVSDRARFEVVAAKLPQGAVWIASHLIRTHQTAAALWDAGAERVEPIAEPAFAEQAFGAWTRMTWAEIWELEDEVAKSFWDAPATTCPPSSPEHSAESAFEVCERVGLRLDDVTAEYAGRDIVCVAHAGSIRAAVAHALGLSAEQALALDVQNVSLTRLDHISDGLRTKRGGSWRVVGVNMI